MPASEKQIDYALYLLDKAGYSTRFMDRTFAELGATMRQRSGRVRNWLSGLESCEISKLIDKLKEKVA